jgi:hypothetical protein
MKDDYATVRMLHLLYVDTEVDRIPQSLRGSVRILKRPRADDLSGYRVGDAKYQPPTTLVGQSDAIIRGSVQLEVALRLLKLNVLVLRRDTQQSRKVLERRGHL